MILRQSPVAFPAEYVHIYSVIFAHAETIHRKSIMSEIVSLCEHKWMSLLHCRKYFTEPLPRRGVATPMESSEYQQSLFTYFQMEANFINKHLAKKEDDDALYSLSPSMMFDPQNVQADNSGEKKPSSVNELEEMHQADSIQNSNNMSNQKLTLSSIQRMAETSIESWIQSSAEGLFHGFILKSILEKVSIWGKLDVLLQTASANRGQESL